MQDGEHLGQFAHVDRASQPRDFVTLLDQLQKKAGARKRRTYEMMQVARGDHVLDVGCGTGADVTALAELVGPNGRVVGIDHSETMIREARQRSRNFAGPTDFVLGEADRLRFPAHSFDACRCERVLEHVEEPQRVLREIARVAKPGARVVAYEPDWGTTTIDAPGAELTERLISFIAQGITSRWIGRQLRRLFLDTGLKRVHIEADVWTITDFDLSAQLLRLESVLDDVREAGVASRTDLDAWIASAREAGRANRFFASLTFFYAIGVKSPADAHIPDSAEQTRGWVQIPTGTPR